MSDRLKQQQREHRKAMQHAMGHAVPGIPASVRPAVPMQSHDDAFLPIKEFAERLGGLSTRTIKRWSQAGDLPPIKYIHGRAVLPASALAEAIRRNVSDRPRKMPERPRGAGGRYAASHPVVGA